MSKPKLCELIYCNTHCYSNTTALPEIASCNVNIHCNISSLPKLTFKYNTVHVNVFLLLYLYIWENWKIEIINNKEIFRIFKKKFEYNVAVHQVFRDFQKAYDSVSREVLYNILIQFGISMNLVRLIKMCLNATYSRVRVGKHPSDMFPTKKVWKMEMLYRHFSSNLFLSTH